MRLKTGFGDDLTSAHIELIIKRLDLERQNYETRELNGMKLTARYVQNYLKRFYNGTDYAIPSEPTINKHINYNKYLEKALNHYAINITLVAQLCRMFNVSMSYILALPDDADVSLLPDSYGSQFTQLDDPNFMGTFSCYMLQESRGNSKASSSKTNTLRKNDEIIECTLKINRISNRTVATLSIPYPRSMGDGYIEVTATGQPIHCKFSNNIIINLASENGRLYTLMYGHDTFYTNTLHFRECVLLSPSPGNPGKPLLSKMILLRHPIRKHDYDFMRGLLSFNVNCVVIAKSKFEEICSDADIKKFKEEFQPFLDLYEQPFYVIPDSLIECNYDTSFNQLELKKIMLKLRNHSYSMAQIEIGTENKGYAIAKELQKIKSSDEITDLIS